MVNDIEAQRFGRTNTMEEATPTGALNFVLDKVDKVEGVIICTIEKDGAIGYAAAGEVLKNKYAAFGLLECIKLTIEQG